MVTAEFLSNGGYDHYLRKARKAYESNIDQMSEAICRHFPTETRITRPLGGFVIWAELPPEINTIALYGKTVERGVTFTPGILFSAHDQYRNFLRLSASRWDADIEKAIALVGQQAKQMLA